MATKQSLTRILKGIGLFFLFSVMIYSTSHAAFAEDGDVVIVLDPGHGGSDVGAISVAGTHERDINLEIAKACKAKLDKYDGITCYLTRNSNLTYYTLKKRASIAEKYGADYLISLHNNSASSSSAHGACVYITQNKTDDKYYKESKKLANKICTNLKNLGLTNNGVLTRSYGSGTYSFGGTWDYYGVIRESMFNKIPAMIVEHAFLSNSGDYYGFLNTSAKLKAIGEADADAILAYYGITDLKSSEDLTINKTSAILYTGEIESFQVSKNGKLASDLTWTSSNPAVATVNDGVVRAVSCGQAVITVSNSDSSQILTATITVEADGLSLVEGDAHVATITFASSETSLYEGETYRQLPSLTSDTSGKKPSNQTLRYRSSDSTVASVDSDGKVTALGKGTCYITARSTDGSGIVGYYKLVVLRKVSSISLSAKSAKITIGKNILITPTVSPANASDTSVVVESLDSSIAKITSNGRIKAVKAGTVKVRFQSKDGGASAYASITVLPKAKNVKILTRQATNMNRIVLKKGTSLQISALTTPRAASDDVTYKVKNTKIASVDENGKVTGIKKGHTTITVKSKYSSAKKKIKVYVTNYKNHSSSFKVTKRNYSKSVGDSFQIKTKLTPVLNTDVLKYTSSKKTVAKVNKYGYVTCLKKGTTKITITCRKKKLTVKVKVK